ncbi:MAG: SDR family NAD(P)-dependent oxidoreductase [Reichenbachiella sp.]
MDTDKKIALITGGTSGVGLSLVTALTQHNYYVYFIGTSIEKGAAIEKTLNTKNTVCTFIQLDLSSLSSTKRFAQSFIHQVPHLNILGNVAGILLPKKTITDEGIEKTFAIGYLSAYILIRELTPLLIKVPHSRILNVGGGPGQILPQRINTNDIQGTTNHYNGIKAAIHAVHAKTVLTQIIAERLKESTTDVNTFHPGIVKSNLGRNFSFPLSLLFKIATLVMPSKSKCGIYTALSEELQGITGNLLVNKKHTPLTFDDEYSEALLNQTHTLLQTLKI